MPDGDSVVGGKVDAHLHGEEAVDLPLRTELGGPGTNRNGGGVGPFGHRLVLHLLGVSFEIIVLIGDVDLRTRPKASRN